MAITVSKPNGAEKFYVGRAQNITWTDSTSQNVKIELSKDGGVTYPTVIVASTTSINGTNNYAWTPSSGDVSTTCMVKVSDAATGTVVDVSNAIFAVASPTITGVKPSGIIIQKFNSVNIVWADSSASTNPNVDILLDSGGGTFGVTIVSNTANTGSYLWDWASSSLTGASGSSFKIRVRSSTTGEDGVGGSLSKNYADSQEPFTVQSADNTPSGTYGTHRDFGSRTELGTRMAGEKAKYKDEAVTRGQIEAGQEIEVLYRNNAGDNFSLTGADEVASGGIATRENLVIRTKRRIPRTVTGTVTCSTLVAGYATSSSPYPYGDHYKGTITHGLNLATKDDFIIQLDQTGTYTDGVIVPQVEALDVNTIVVHIIDKNTPTSQQSKDEVTGTFSNVFKYKITETR